MLETVLQEENVEEGAMNESNVSTEGDDFYTWEKKNQQRYLVWNKRKYIKKSNI